MSAEGCTFPFKRINDETTKISNRLLIGWRLFIGSQLTDNWSGSSDEGRAR